VFVRGSSRKKTKLTRRREKEEEEIRMERTKYK
jgi:hypothetical protein